MPKRIQRKRTKGWRMPEGAVYVGRPTKWGNPYKVGRKMPAGLAVLRYRLTLDGNVFTSPNAFDIMAELHGKDLVCWCPLDKPCHADVLLEMASLARLTY